jgi:hypothetical protein
VGEAGFEPAWTSQRVYSPPRQHRRRRSPFRIGCRSASRTRLRTAYETARTPGLPAGTSDHGSLKLVESRELESHTSRCHRVSKPRRRACPVDSPWRKAAVPIRSARAPNPFPTGAGPCPVHFPNWRRAGALEAHAFRHHRRSKPRRSPDRFTLPNWPARQDSNLHPRVPETRARPIELRAMKNGAGSAGDR